MARLLTHAISIKPTNQVKQVLTLELGWLQLWLHIIIHLGLLLHEEIDAHWSKLSSVLVC
jgi:hypothetical protein